jgi:hypothetical protein
MAEPSRRECTVLLVTDNGMGSAEPALRQRLFAKYLRLLEENNMLPAAICFCTEGAYLVAEGSPVLELLRSLEAQGVNLLVCLTCLEHYGLVDRVRVGTVGGMPAIIAAHWAATKVITSDATHSWPGAPARALAGAPGQLCVAGWANRSAPPTRKTPYACTTSRTSGTR